MTANLAQKLESLDTGTDYSDPNTYAALLYGDQADEGAAPAPQGETVQPAPAPAAEVKTESSEAPAAAETNANEAVDGVLTRDGKRVIPYDVLAEARKTATTNAQRATELAEANRQLQEQIEALKTGKPADPATQPKGRYSAERIAQVRDDFPEMAEMMESQNALIDQLAEMRTAPAAAVRQEPDEAAAVQAEIDNLPLLTRWQSKGGPVWAAAVELDQALQTDPVWSAKPQGERFAEVQRRVAEDLGIPIPTASNTTAAPAPQNKAPAPIAAPSPSITDFNGSAPALPGARPLDGLAVGQAVDKAMAMSLEEIQRMVGVNV